MGRLADAEAMTVPVDAALDAAVDAVATSRGGWVPVLDSDMRVVGIVANSDLVRGWRMAMRHAIRRLGRAARHAMVVEATVERARRPTASGSPSSRCRAAPYWSRSLRGNGLMFADADTLLCAGDLVSAFTGPATRPNSTACSPPLPPNRPRALPESAGARRRRRGGDRPTRAVPANRAWAPHRPAVVR